MKNTQTLSAKLKISYAIMVFLILLGSTASAVGLWVLGATLDNITQKTAVRASDARDLLASYVLLGQHARNTALLSDLKLIDQESASYKSELAHFASMQTRLQADSAVLDAAKEESDVQRELESKAKAVIEALNQAVAAGTAGDSSTAVRILTVDMRADETLLLKSLNDFIAIQDKLTLEAIELANTLKAVLYGVLCAIAIISFVVAIAAASHMTKSVAGRVGLAVEQAKAIAAGDLRAQTTPLAQDEVGQLLVAIEAMRQQLMQLVSEITRSAQSIEHAAIEVSVGNQDLSNRTESSAMHIEQTNSWVKGLAEAVDQNSHRAVEAGQLAKKTNAITAQARNLVRSAVEKMSDISKSSDEISTITSVIDGIAFQTNILALNAAVEAARAGEHGRGFAVVASEVRLLASRAADAAKQIKELVETSVANSKQGSGVIFEAGNSMGEVLESVGTLAEFVEEIQMSGMNQSRELSDVATAVAKIESAIQQNAALVEETSAAANALKDHSSQLLKQTQYFVVDHPVALY